MCARTGFGVVLRPVLTPCSHTLFSRAHLCLVAIICPQAQRSDFLFTKQARIVAMTCTHAALARSRLLDLGFTYDTLIMEEAAQVLEIETFVPLALQNSDPTVPGGCRLKRVVLIGDHHQLPPVVKNPAFQKYGKLDQSLFARLVRLGVPTVQLDAQGRARPGIAKLYSWRYNNLGNLPAVTGTVAEATAPGSSSAAAVRAAEYCLPNPGFAHEFQFVDVGDFQGAGESVPTPHFFQNLGEAEFVVATYMYMRLCGYPAAKISILTTYNGQKHLIRDVLQVSAIAIVGAVEAAAARPAASFFAAERDFLLTLATRTHALLSSAAPVRAVHCIRYARLRHNGRSFPGAAERLHPAFASAHTLHRAPARPTSSCRCNVSCSARTVCLRAPSSFRELLRALARILAAAQPPSAAAAVARRGLEACTSG